MQRFSRTEIASAPSAAEAAPLATVAEVARHLGVSRSKLYQLMDAGGLPYVRLGRCRRIRWADVDHFINEHHVGPA